MNSTSLVMDPSSAVVSVLGLPWLHHFRRRHGEQRRLMGIVRGVVHWWYTDFWVRPLNSVCLRWPPVAPPGWEVVGAAPRPRFHQEDRAD